MGVTLDWLGCATFRLTIDGLVVFLDAYMDRVPTAPPVGLSPKDVTAADFILVGHSHFDHLAGAEVIARNTGARIIASNESCRVMREHQVPREQLLPSQGGERHRLAAGVTVRVFPAVHTCLWVGVPGGMADVCTGDLGLTEDERAAVGTERNPFAEVFRGENEWTRTVLEHMRTATGSFRDGGPLVYCIETPYGSIFYQDTTGCWSGVLREIRADVALLAAAGRPNHDGEPFQGSLAQFIAMEAALLQAPTIVIDHHDNWLGNPDFSPMDMAPLRAELARAVPDTRLVEMGYREAVPLLAG